MEWMHTVLERWFNEGSLQWTEEEDRTQWTHAQESMMEGFEERSRRGALRDKESVSAFRNEKMEGIRAFRAFAISQLCL